MNPQLTTYAMADSLNRQTSDRTRGAREANSSALHHAIIGNVRSAIAMLSGALALAGTGPMLGVCI